MNDAPKLGNLITKISPFSTKLKVFKKKEILMTEPAYKTECLTVNSDAFEGMIEKLKLNVAVSMVMLDSIDDLTSIGFTGTAVDESVMFLIIIANLPDGMIC